MDDLLKNIHGKFNAGLHAKPVYEKAITTLGNMAAEINTGYRPSQIANLDNIDKKQEEKEI